MFDEVLTMGGVYTAAFIIPAGAGKVLEDVGWVFASTRRLPEHALNELSRAMDLGKSGAYLGMDTREGEKAKAIAVRDEQGGIEHIFVQLRASTPDQLRNIFSAAGFSDLEVFVPNERLGGRLGAMPAATSLSK